MLQFVEDGPTAEHVTCLAIVRITVLIIDHFWCNVPWGSALRKYEVCSVGGRREPKIYQFKGVVVLIILEHYVLWLQVSMHNILIMYVS
jgi:hypothetical protein